MNVAINYNIRQSPLDSGIHQQYVLIMPVLFPSSLARTYLVIQSLNFLILLFLLLIATSAAPTNLTTPLFPTFASDNTNSDSYNYSISVQCTKVRTWVADGLHRKDCNDIIDYIYQYEVLRREGDQFEFISLGATTTKIDLPKIVTPRKYAYGTCVVTIAMLDQFRPRELPGSDFRERYDETDVATFDAIWDTAIKVDFVCGRYGHAGWVAAGE